MNRLLRLLIILLSVATGALFIYSAYTKLFPTIPEKGDSGSVSH